jgi:preprotein translocase subunit SecE
MAKKKNNKKNVNSKEKKITEVVNDAEELEEAEVTEEVEVKDDKKDAKSKKSDKKIKVAKPTEPKKHWFKDFKAEIKKIVWPTGKKLFDNTVVVITMVIVVALIIFVLDLGFKALSGLEVNELNRLKSEVAAESSNTTSEVTDATITEDSTSAEGVTLINGTEE